MKAEAARIESELGTHERCWLVEFDAEANAAQHKAKSLTLAGRSVSESDESGRRDRSVDLMETLA